VPHHRGGPIEGLPAGARDDPRPASSRGSRSPLRRRHLRRVLGPAPLRRAALEALHLGAHARGGDRQDGARAGRVPGGRTEHDDPVPPSDDGSPRVPERGPQHTFPRGPPGGAPFEGGSVAR
jgi:hypothetical protein